MQLWSLDPKCEACVRTVHRQNPEPTLLAKRGQLVVTYTVTTGLRGYCLCTYIRLSLILCKRAKDWPAPQQAKTTYTQHSNHKRPPSVDVTASQT